MGSFAPPPTTALSPGDRLDRYELLCVLAQGGMGTVWLARITGKHGFERLVALKTILALYGNDRQFCDMFLDEARIAAGIDHENVARILEIGEDRAVLYHAMELIDGESLRKLYRDIRTAGAPFPLAVALRIAADTCAGLHAVHELRDQHGVPLEVVHRDVSPQNILLTVRGTIKLIDFGVAKARERRTEETTAGTLKGKIEYMAPEQARGEAMDRRADVYAVGAVLYELLSGEAVRNTEDGRQLLALHDLMTGAPYEPLHSSIPLPVRTLVDRALSRDPTLRYRTADDMRHALEQAMHTIGHSATSDDVANVLAHFSRERTLRRKEAIDAAVRAAQALAEARARASIHAGAPGESGEHGSSYAGRATEVAASAVPSPPRQAQAGGAGGTQLIGVAPVAVGEGSGTGPSMRTMQGASMSGPPPSPPSPAGRVIGAVIVLSFVAVLGVLGGVLLSRGSATKPTTLPAASGTTDVPVVTATPIPVASAKPGTPAVAGDVGLPGTIIGASDGGAAGTSTSTKPAVKKVRGKERAGGQKGESGDEYGF